MKQHLLSLRRLVNVLMLAVLIGLPVGVSAQPTKAEDFRELVRQANERSVAQDWLQAIPRWERVVAINPHVAAFWYALGTAQINAGENRRALPAMEKAFELGARTRSIIAFEIARAHARLNEKEPALKWLEQAMALGFRSRPVIRNEAAFALLRDEPRFKTLTGEVDTSRMSRVEGWRYDLTLLETEIKRMHYYPFRQVSQAKFEAEARQLRDEVPKLTDNQVIVRMMRLMALVGDGHTGAFPDLGPIWPQALPLQFGLFQEGLYVISADPKFADLVGTQVQRIGQHTPEQVIQAVGPIISKDNEQGITRGVVNFIRYPQVLNGLGLQAQSDRIELTVRDGEGKTRTASVAAVEVDSQFNRIFGHPGWKNAYDQTPGAMPLYLKDRQTNYWFEHLPESKAVYFQFNLVVPSPNESFNAFLERLFKYVDEHDIEKLIVDMRWNNGGNALTLMPLVNGLVRSKVNRSGRLFVIVGRYTFSAAIPAAAWIERHTNAIFVGEPTPSGPNVIAESNISNLPYSRIPVSISDFYWQGSWPNDRRTWIAPLYFVPPTFAAYKAKRDPALELILAYRDGE